MNDTSDSTIINEDIETCPIHGCPLEDSISATEEETEYFTYCPECEAEYEKYILSASYYVNIPQLDLSFEISPKGIDYIIRKLKIVEKYYSSQPKVITE